MHNTHRHRHRSNRRARTDRLYVVDTGHTLVGVLLAVDVFRLVLQVQCANESGEPPEGLDDEGSYTSIS